MSEQNPSQLQPQDAGFFSVCFTGYRPAKMPFPMRPGHPLYDAFFEKAAAAVLRLYDEGARVFFTGMAQGCDMMFAELVLALKKTNPGVRLVCVLPFAAQCGGWGASETRRHSDILSCADKVITVSEQASAAAFMARNRFMAEHSDLVLAVYDGKSGGTHYTVHFARKINRRIWVLSPSGTLTEQGTI